MYYEEMKRREKAPRKRHSFWGRLIRLILALAIICVTVNAVPAILAGGWTHVLLLGEDYASGERGRTDTIIIASVNALGRVKLTSVMRDTMVDIPGHGRQKINAAYRVGGAELAMETVSEAFGINIRYYAVVSLRAFPLVIDALGGVTLDVTDAERQSLNKSLASTAKILAKYGIDASSLQSGGDGVRLTGAQALAYARIRKIDSDYARSGRQREVLNAMLREARTCLNPVRVIKAAGMGLKVVKTNAPRVWIVSAGLTALARGDISELRLPADGTFDAGTIDGTWSIRANLDKNRALLIDFLDS